MKAWRWRVLAGSFLDLDVFRMPKKKAPKATYSEHSESQTWLDCDTFLTLLDVHQAQAIAHNQQCREGMIRG